MEVWLGFLFSELMLENSPTLNYRFNFGTQTGISSWTALSLKSAQLLALASRLVNLDAIYTSFFCTKQALSTLARAQAVTRI